MNRTALITLLVILLVAIGGAALWYTFSQPTETTTTNETQNEAIVANENSNTSALQFDCTTNAGLGGFLMSDGKCYAPGENIPDTDCFVSETGGCKGLE